MSTIDLSTNWLLIAGARGKSLAEAARKLGTARNLNLDTLTAGVDAIDVEHKLHSALGISQTGASLIRPDGFVAWRSREGGDGATQALETALQKILG